MKYKYSTLYHICLPLYIYINCTVYIYVSEFKENKIKRSTVKLALNLIPKGEIYIYIYYIGSEIIYL